MSPERKDLSLSLLELEFFKIQTIILFKEYKASVTI